MKDTEDYVVQVGVSEVVQDGQKIFREGYKIVNKKTGVVEGFTLFLYQALLGIDEYQTKLDEARKPKAAEDELPTL